MFMLLLERLIFCQLFRLRECPDAVEELGVIFLIKNALLKQLCFMTTTPSGPKSFGQNMLVAESSNILDI